MVSNSLSLNDSFDKIKVYNMEPSIGIIFAFSIFQVPKGVNHPEKELMEIMKSMVSGHFNPNIYLIVTRKFILCKTETFTSN